MKFLRTALKILIVIFAILLSYLIYETYNFIGLTTFSAMANKVEIECYSEGLEKTIILEGDAAETYSNSWSSCGFDPKFRALCYNPAFNIIFHTSYGAFKAKGVCFGCNNFAMGFIGFYPNPDMDIIDATKKHFPKAFAAP